MIINVNDDIFSNWHKNVLPVSLDNVNINYASPKAAFALAAAML